jgi:hypothetical protein
MEQERRLTIRLELELIGDTIVGRAISDQQTTDFTGWIGLMGSIEALLESGAPADDRPRMSPPSTQEH